MADIALHSPVGLRLQPFDFIESLSAPKDCKDTLGLGLRHMNLGDTIQSIVLPDESTSA